MFQKLSKNDYIRALVVWNELSSKINSIIQRQQICTKSRKDIDGSILPLQPTLEVRIQESIPLTALAAEDLNDARVIDKVLDEVIHLEAEKEILSQQQLKAEPLSPRSSQLQKKADPLSPKSSQLQQKADPLPPRSSGHQLQKEDDAQSIIPEETKKPWHCSVCNSNFESEAEQKEHAKLHLKVKHFKCTQCPSSFSTKGNLNGNQFHNYYTKAQIHKTFESVHLRSHSGERPYSCSKCSARFSSSGNLRRHLLSHQGLKPYR